jgi:PhnB protein
MGIPENSARVIPRLICAHPADELRFIVDTFDAISVNERPGPDGLLAHALLTLGPQMLMIEAVWPTLPSRAPAADGTSPVVIFVYVEDVDATVKKAVAGGAEVLVPAADQFWGDRIAWVKDPEGHVWTIASRIEETTAVERTERWTKILEERRSL